MLHVESETKGMATRFGFSSGVRGEASGVRPFLGLGLGLGTNTIRTWKGDDRSIDSSMNLIGDGRSEPRQSSPHRTAVKFVYLNSELLIRLGLARLSATACLTVCSFFPLFPSSTRS